MRTIQQVFNWAHSRNEAGVLEVCIFAFSSNVDAYSVCDFWPQAINLGALFLQMPLTFLCNHYQ